MATARVRYRVKGSKLYITPSNSYDAAGTGRRSRAWSSISGGPNIVSGNLRTLQSRSRDAVRNKALADSAVDKIASNVVGTGIKPQFSTPDGGLNKELGELWLEWTDEADADDALDFYGQQALAVRSMVEAGEVFGRLRPRFERDGLSVPLQIQLLESEFCPVEKTEGDIKSGIEFDAIGRRVAYWMLRNHPNDVNALATINEAHRVAAEDVVHLRELRRPGQLRGEPWLTRALVKLHDLDQYDDAELVRKKVAAMVAGFVKRPVPDGMTADDLKEDWGDSAAIEDGAGMVSLEPGTMQYLDVGEDVEFTNPTDVGGSYEPFMRTQMRALAVSAGILYEQLTGDYSQINDRTFRASVNEFRRRAQMWQHHLVAFQWCRPIHRRWLEVAELSGAIRRPAGMTDSEFYRVNWVPQGWSYIHPVQDVDAAVKEIRAGLTSRSAKVSERGYDAEQIDAEQARDNARAETAGLSYDSDGRRSWTDPTKQAGDSDAADQED